MATQAEIKQAIIDAMEEGAARFLSGQANFDGGICVDEDGNVTIGGGTPDDPATELDESLSSRAGGCKAATDGLQEVLNAMHAWYASGTVTDQQAEKRLELLYGFETSLANHFAQYWYTTYQNSSGQVTINEAALDGMFFCKGLTMNTFAEYVYEQHATAAEIVVLEVFITDFPPEQLDVWFARGEIVPSTDYLSYSCTKIQTEEFTLDMSTGNAPAYTTNGVWKAGHRYLIEATGSYEDTDEADLVGDAMYFHETDTGIKTFSSLNFNFSGSVSSPVQANVPFSETHSYAFTVEKAVGSGNSAGIISRDNGAMATPNVTGILAIKVTDLGEFAL